MPTLNRELPPAYGIAVPIQYTKIGRFGSKDFKIRFLIQGRVPINVIVGGLPWLSQWEKRGTGYAILEFTHRARKFRLGLDSGIA